jgi:hypothetical protein
MPAGREKSRDVAAMAPTATVPDKNAEASAEYEHSVSMRVAAVGRCS